jgi:hypothetical protein
MPKLTKPAPKSGLVVTHESFCHSIAALAITHGQACHGLTGPEVALLCSVKLVYGAGPDGARGVTYYNRWKPRAGFCGCKAEHGPKCTAPNVAPVPLVAISALYQHSPEHLIEVVLHELGHVLAGHAAGHDQPFKDACKRLGLLRAVTAASDWSWDYVEQGAFCAALRALPRPTEGQPVVALPGWLPPAGGPDIGPHGSPVKRPVWKPCSAGRGTKGGTSRGPGSGSRLMLYHCQCKPKPCKVRFAGRDLDATCNRCKQGFVLVEASVPHASGASTRPGPTKAQSKAVKAGAQTVPARKPRKRPSKPASGQTPNVQGVTAADLQKPLTGPKPG